MKLLKDRILVKSIKKEDNTTESGIILGTKPKTINDFEVLIIGPNVKHIKVRDIVRKFPNVAGIPIEYNGVDCLLLSEEHDIEFVL